MADEPVLLATGATGLVMSHVVRCWLAAHPEVDDLILSGGDPLTLSDGRLRSLLECVAPHVPIVRIGTRQPTTLPQRITPALCELLARFSRFSSCKTTPSKTVVQWWQLWQVGLCKNMECRKKASKCLSWRLLSRPGWRAGGP